MSIIKSWIMFALGVGATIMGSNSIYVATAQEPGRFVVVQLSSGRSGAHNLQIDLNREVPPGARLVAIVESDPYYLAIVER